MGTFAIEEKAVRDAGQNWAEAIAAGNVDRILDLYDEKAILLGTLSQVTRKDPQAIREYFRGFCCRESMKGEFTDINIRLFDKVAVNSGTYVFTWMQEGKKVRVPARFTFVYKLDRGSWKIIEHHSSLIPGPSFDPAGYIVE